MQLKLFKTLWGFDGSYIEAAELAKEQGYDGIEGPVPGSMQETEQLALSLQQHQLFYISELATTGTYVPDRRLSVNDHLNDLNAKLDRIKYLEPLFITCLGGCDAWDESDSVRFLNEALEITDRLNIDISFETHRGRIFFNPWITQRLLKNIPDLKLTCDFSHWCVVCEGLQTTEDELIQSLTGNAWHIHGRIGYDQGPQVPDPRSRVYQDDVQKHLQWWQWIWVEHKQQKRTITTLTPEFGPDGYDYRDITNDSPLVDVDEINLWIAGTVREQFSRTM